MNIGDLMVSLALNINDFDRKLAEAEAESLSFTETLKTIFASADPNVDIRVKDGVAEIKVEDFKALLDTVPDEKVTHLRADASGGGIGGGAAATAAAGGAAAGAGPLAGIIAGVIPAIAPLAAAATSGIMGLASAFTAAGAGAVGFGAVAVSNLKTIFTASSNLSAAQKAYNNAVTDKQRQAALQKEAQAMHGLNAAQVQAVKSLQSFKSFWDSFSSSFQKPVLSLFSTSLKTIEKILTDLKPTISAAAGAFGTLMSQFNTALGGAQAKQFFDFLAKNAGPDIKMFGDMFGNVFGGVMNLMVAFAPTGRAMLQSMTQMSVEFRKWAANLKGTKGFEDFLKYAAKSGKAVLDLIGNLAKLVGTLLKDMAPLGLTMVKLVSDLAKWINQLMTTNPLISMLVKLIFGAVRNILLFVDGVIKLFTWLGKTHPVIMDIITAVGLATAAFFAFNAVLDANPISLIIIAIALLVAAGVELVKHWGAVKQFFSQLWTWFTTETSKVWKGISRFFDQLWNSIVSGVKQNWNDVKTFFSATWDAIKKVATAFWDDEKKGLETIWKGIVNVGKATWNDFKKGLDVVWNGISSVARAFWNREKQGWTNIWNGLVNDAKTIFGGLGKFFTGLWTQAEQWGSNLVHHVAQGITNAISAVRNAVHRVASTVGNFLGFHSPTKEGPGSEADSWMPNLMNMLVDGIQSGTPKLRSALSSAIASPSALGGFGSLSTGNMFSSVGGSSRPVVVYLDGRELARGTAPHLVDEIRLETGLTL